MQGFSRQQSDLQRNDASKRGSYEKGGDRLVGKSRINFYVGVKARHAKVPNIVIVGPQGYKPGL